MDQSEFVDKSSHKDVVINHGNGVVQEFYGSDEFWYQDGKLHLNSD
jgi:hypothetical protein